MTPSRSSLKKCDKVILLVSSFFALAITFSHTRGWGGKEKKGDNDSKEMEGKKDEVQWRMGGSVSVCVSACVYMLISQIGDDDTQQAKINRNPLRWHLSAWSSH